MKKLVVNKKQGIYIFFLDDIIYMEKKLRKIKLYTKGTEIEFYGKFADILEFLDKRFLYCHRSYIINMDKIVVMSYNNIYFENNDSIYMGRETYGKARKIFDQYLKDRRAQKLAESVGKMCE